MEKQLKLEILERGKFDEKKQHLKKENVYYLFVYLYFLGRHHQCH